MSPSAAELFGHLDAMTDERGLFEHAEFDRPRPEHGYCTDDNARMLVVTSREPDEGVPARLARVALGFVNLAMTSDGTVRNRMTPAGTFSDAPATGDWWGRAMWGLGAAAAHHDDPTVAACFVADRLDLSRVGFRPDPRRMPAPAGLLTDAVIEAAMERERVGLRWAGGAEIETVWGVRPA